MAGLNHDFYLLDINNFDYHKYPSSSQLSGGISIYDDHLAYMSDTLRWIRCYNPVRREAYDGLCWYGPTVIRIEGAEAAAKVFQSWANLFNLGPETLNLRGYYTHDGDDGNGYYERLEISRDEFVLKLNTLATYAQKIIDTNGQYFILHYGI